MRTSRSCSDPGDLDVNGLLAGIPTILDAIRERAGAGSVVHYAVGCGLMDGTDEQLEAAVLAATGADVAVVVVGERSGLTDDCQSGEARDRLELGLPGRQSELVAAVVATGTPVVLVLVSGRPLAIAHRGRVMCRDPPRVGARRRGCGRYHGRVVRRRLAGRQATGDRPLERRPGPHLLRPQAIGRPVQLEG